MWLAACTVDISSRRSFTNTFYRLETFTPVQVVSIHTVEITDSTVTDVLVADPLFYLHHANIDRLWWKWESAGT